MAKKFSKDAYYFPHDSNANSDPKCMMLIHQLGAEGYGIFWILLETLREQSDYKYHLSLVPVLADRFRISAEKMKAVINDYGLFVIDNESETFYSESLIERLCTMNLAKARRVERAQKAAATRWGLPNVNNHAQALPEHGNKDAKAEHGKCKSMHVDATRLDYTKLDYTKLDYTKLDESKEKFRSNVLSILSYFNLNVENNPAQASLSFRFVRYLSENNTLDYFLKQFEAYQTYKSEANEYRHSLNKFIGDESEGYQNGGWNADNWIEKLAGIKQKNSAESDYDKKTREMVNKMSW